MPTSTTVATSLRRRKAGTIAVNITFEREAVEILRQLAPPGKRGTGRLVARLIYEHVARMEERQRLHQRLSSVMTEEDVKA